MGASEYEVLRSELAELRSMVRQLVARDGERPRLYELQAAARLLSVAPKTVSRMVATGELVTVQVRGKRLIPAEEIDRLCSPTPVAPKSSGASPERVKLDVRAAVAKLRAARRRA